MDEPEDKGYTVKDRRYLHMSEEEKARAQEPPLEETLKPEMEGPLPEITFSSFILSLSSSVFISLGAMAEPQSGTRQKNLPLAKQTIDLLALLRDKTRGNLTTEEENLFDHLLYDLRMAYIKEAG